MGPHVFAALWASAALLFVNGLASAAEPITYHNQIARIFQRHCVSCHQPGTVAPFSLTNYREAHAWRQQILTSVQARKMPPWKPAPGFVALVGSRRLSDADVESITRWVRAGAPEGSPRDLPPPTPVTANGSSRRGDLVIALESPFDVPPNHRDLYRCFTVPTNLTEDRYVTAIEIVPGNRKILHHVLAYLDPHGESVSLDRAEPGPGYACFGGPGLLAADLLGAWAPGVGPEVMRPGIGLLLPARARVVIQAHYHNHGTATETDRTSIRLTFAKAPIKQRLRTAITLNQNLVIPAGAARHVVRAAFRVPSGLNLLATGIAPHMHLLGREITVTATLPGSAVRTLIHIDDWDFNWQGVYTFAKPVELPGGTLIEVRGVYDNSAANPRNPNSPPRETRWGEGTTDEMLLVILRFVHAGERLDRPPQRARDARS
jgi:mono/diheme cytochrome c family protein